MGKPSSKEYYFNKATEDLACAKLERVWPTMVRDPKPPIDRNSREPQDEKLWRLSEGGTGYLGIRPRLMAAVLLLRFGTSDTVTQESLRVEPGEVNIAPVKDNIGGSAVPNKRNIPHVMGQLLKKSARVYKGYAPELDGIYFTSFTVKMVTRYHEMRGTTAPEDEVLRAQVARVWANLEDEKPAYVKDVLALLKPLLPADAEYMPVKDAEPQEQDFSRGSHVIAAPWMRYIDGVGDLAHAENPKVPRMKAQRVLKELATEQGVMLHGNAISGKSSVVVEVLRHLARETDDDTISLKTSNGVLPVCLINVRECSGLEVALRILSFLRTIAPNRHRYTYEKELEHLRAMFGDGDKIVEMDEVHGKIAALCHVAPAFFIFTNWDEKGESAPRTMMRDQSKTALARLIQSNSKYGRMFITTLGSDIPKPEKRFRSTLPKMKLIGLRDPVFSQINRYWIGLKIDRPEHEELIDELARKIGDHNIPGAHLMLIAVLLQLVGRHPDRPSYQAAFQTVRDKLRTYADAVTARKGRQPNRLNAAVRPLIRLLMEELHRQNLNRIVLAVASSDDGLRRSSVEKMLGTWSAQSGIPLIRDNPLHALEKILTPLAAGFFLRPVPSADRNRHQLDQDEQPDEKDEQFEVNQTIREMIFEEIFHPDSATWTLADAEPTCADWTRGAMRHISILARHRARNWRLNAPMGNLTRNWRDLLPDMQAYQSLLASFDAKTLPESEFDETDVPEVASRLQEVSVFRESQFYDTRLALRFAVNCLLRREIDFNGRLSMVYDQDHQRTNLYVLPFMPLGKKHFLRAVELSQKHLPAKMPAHIRSCFSASEILDMLTSAALSAYHSQCVDTLVWSKKMFEQEWAHVKGTAPETLKLLTYQGARIQCSAIDMSIQRGRPIWYAPAAEGNHTKTLAELSQMIRQGYDDVNGLFGDTSAKGFGRDQIECGLAALQDRLIADRLSDPTLPVWSDKKIVAWMRFKVREATLMDLTGQNEAAICIYEGLHRVECLLEAYFGKVGPVVMTGRPARSEISAYLRSRTFQSHGRGASATAYAKVEEHVESLILANTARLSKFGGADQAATSIDRALFTASRRGGDPRAAMALAHRARNAVNKDQASLSMHVHILSAHLHIATEALRAAPSRPAPVDLGELLEDAELLLGLARSLHLKPILVQAYFHRAVIRWNIIRAGVSVLTKGDVLEDLSDAQSISVVTGHHPFHDDIQSFLIEIRR